MAVAAQSHAEYAFEITRDYIRKRKAFGNSLSKLQVIYRQIESNEKPKFRNKKSKFRKEIMFEIICQNLRLNK